MESIIKTNFSSYISMTSCQKNAIFLKSKDSIQPFGCVYPPGDDEHDGDIHFEGDEIWIADSDRGLITDNNRECKCQNRSSSVLKLSFYFLKAEKYSEVFSSEILIQHFFF